MVAKRPPRPQLRPTCRAIMTPATIPVQGIDTPLMPKEKPWTGRLVWQIAENIPTPTAPSTHSEGRHLGGPLVETTPSITAIQLMAPLRKPQPLVASGVLAQPPAPATKDRSTYSSQIYKGSQSRAYPYHPIILVKPLQDATGVLSSAGLVLVEASSHATYDEV